MALTVDTREAVDQRAKDDPFGAGAALMIIGLESVTEKNILDAQSRIEFVNALDHHRWGRPSINFGAHVLLGVKANVTTETTTRWSARITKHFMKEVGTDNRRKA